MTGKTMKRKDADFERALGAEKEDEETKKTKRSGEGNGGGASSLLRASREQVLNAMRKKKKRNKNLVTNEEEEEKEAENAFNVANPCGMPARDRNEEGPDDDLTNSLSSDSSEVEWEDVETEEEEEEEIEENESAAANDDDAKEEDERDSECEIVDEITGDPNEIKVKNKNKRRITRQERNKIKELHHAELLCRLARVHLVNRALESDALRCLALSVAPRGLVEGILERPGKKEGKPVVRVMLHFAVKFFQDHVLSPSRCTSDNEEEERSSWTPYVSAKEARASKAGFAGGVAWKLSEMLRRKDKNINETMRLSSFSNVSEMKAALLCAFLRALGIRARLCASLKPLPHDAKGPDLDRKTTLRSLDGKPANIFKAMEKNGAAARNNGEEDDDAADEITHWLEALVREGGNDTTTEESTRKKTKKKKTTVSSTPSAANAQKKKESAKFVPIALSPTTHTFTIGDVDDIVKTWSTYPGYVVAFDEFDQEKNGNVLSFTDVTRKYSQKQFAIKALKKRIKGDQRWNELSAAHKIDLSGIHDNDEENSSQLYLKKALIDERDEMATMQKSERPPKTLTEIKLHPLWCIEAHLRQNECIYPKTGVAGCVDGKLVYPRENVQTLRTDRRWKSEKRLMVKHVEIDSPIKKLLSNKARAHLKQYGGHPEQFADIFLYGQWQCTTYHPPKADKGVVPTNDRGNVDLTKNGDGLPDGCAYIEDKNALTAARKLTNPQIHAVPALIGFEYKQGGTTLPVFLGCVVVSENEERVRKQLLEDEQERVKKEKLKKLKDASLKWRTLLGAMFMKERLRREVDVQENEDTFQTTLATKVEKL